LVQQWAAVNGTHYEDLATLCGHVATQAAQWGADQQLKLDAEQIAQAHQAGADQELEACCEWLKDPHETAKLLRAARRPTPPSLKEQALKALEQLQRDPEAGCFAAAPDTIRKALEQLNDE
jgi:gamma-glutamyl:cysteine ligase YbdK (ATP-grasp superfamily)